MKEFFTRFFGTGSKGIILVYCLAEEGNTTPVDGREFERQMHYIKQKYKAIPLSEMCLRLREGRSVYKCVAITFDGGRGDFFAKIFPALKRSSLPSTIFLPAGDLGMNEGDIKRASIANDLIEFMPSSSGPIGEINTARLRVEALSNKPADILAYQGKYDAETVSLLKRSGSWLGAVTLDRGMIDKDSDVFLLRRTPVTFKTSLSLFKKIMSGRSHI